jgi:MFS transporter, UMF1 family
MLKGTAAQRAWYYFDWAVSAYSTTVIAVFLGPYLTSVAQAAAIATGAFTDCDVQNCMVYPFGPNIHIATDAIFPYVTSLSVLLQVFFLPILGAVADYTNLKKRMLGIFAYVATIATVLMFFIEGENYLLGAGLYLVANLAFGASMVFYNAFLPDIASADERDAVSSRGFAWGYLGGGLLLVLNLVIYIMHDTFGLTGGMAVRVCLASAGIWMAIFLRIPLTGLRESDAARQLAAGQNVLSAGFAQLGETIRGAGKYPMTMLFLAAYLLYNDGVQTVISLSSQFGTQELGMESQTLIITILMVQFVAFVGAYAFNAVAARIGAKSAIAISLVIWAALTGVTYYIAKGSVPQFLGLGAGIAIVLGGTQALSRSLYAQMIPHGKEAEYYSLYEVSERGTSWIGPLVFGLVLQFTGSYRLALVMIGFFFIAGLLLLLFVNVRRAITEAGNTPPARV